MEAEIKICKKTVVILVYLYLSDLYNAFPQTYIISKVLNKYNLYIIKIFTDK